MSISTFRRLYSLISSTSVISLALAVGGCSDMMVNTVQTRNAGIKQYNDGQYAEAAGTFRINLRSNPSDYGSHYFYGASLAKLGQYEQAIEQYKTTLVIMKDDLVGKEDHVFRLQCLNSLADAAVASKDRDMQSILVPGAPPWEGQFLMAKISRGQGDADAALEAYAQASLLAPAEFAVAKEYGLFLLQLSQTDKARSELRRAYALNQKDSQVASALRRVGVVPGPSLKDEKDLVRPVVPIGPIPEVELAAPAAAQTEKPAPVIAPQ